MMEYPSNDNPADLTDVLPGMPGHHGMMAGLLPLSAQQTPPDTIEDLTPPNIAMLPVNLRIEPMEWRQYRYQTRFRE